MTTHIKTALALMTGVVLGGVGFGALRAQTKAQPAYWVTEVLEMRDQAAFMKAIQAVPPTVQNFGGRYIVLGGKRRYRTSAKANCHRCVRQHGQGAGMVERPHGQAAARRSQQTRPDARLCRRGDCQLGGPGARFARRASVSPGPPTQVSHRLGRHELGQPARRWLACARMIEGGAMTACGPFETCADGVCRSAYGARSVLGQCASYC